MRAVTWISKGACSSRLLGQISLTWDRSWRIDLQGEGGKELNQWAITILTSQAPRLQIRRTKTIKERIVSFQKIPHWTTEVGSLAQVRDQSTMYPTTICRTRTTLSSSYTMTWVKQLTIKALSQPLMATIKINLASKIRTNSTRQSNCLVNKVDQRSQSSKLWMRGESLIDQVVLMKEWVQSPMLLQLLVVPQNWSRWT